MENGFHVVRDYRKKGSEKMGRSIYFTDQELKKVIDYMNEAIGILGVAEETCCSVAEDMENGLGSAMRKIYKGKKGECIYEEYKTKRGKRKC